MIFPQKGGGHLTPRRQVTEMDELPVVCARAGTESFEVTIPPFIHGALVFATSSRFLICLKRSCCTCTFETKLGIFHMLGWFVLPHSSIYARWVPCHLVDTSVWPPWASSLVKVVMNCKIHPYAGICLSWISQGNLGSKKRFDSNPVGAFSSASRRLSICTAWDAYRLLSCAKQTFSNSTLFPVPIDESTLLSIYASCQCLGSPYQGKSRMNAFVN